MISGAAVLGHLSTPPNERGSTAKPKFGPPVRVDFRVRNVKLRVIFGCTPAVFCAMLEERQHRDRLRRERG